MTGGYMFWNTQHLSDATRRHCLEKEKEERERKKNDREAQ